MCSVSDDVSSCLDLYSHLGLRLISEQMTLLVKYMTYPVCPCHPFDNTMVLTMYIFSFDCQQHTRNEKENNF